MKKFLLITVFIIFSTVSYSQVLITLLLGDKLNSDKLKFGLEGGMNWSNISGMQTSAFARYFNLGFYFDFELKNKLRFYTGTLVKSNLGTDDLAEADLEFLNIIDDNINSIGNYRQVSTTFLVPAFIKYDFKNHFYFEVGPQFGLMYKAYVEFTSDENGIEYRIRQDNKDMLQRIDAGIGGGFGYTLSKGEGISIGIKYYHGFVDVYKDKQGTHNNSINLKANIRIGAKKLSNK